MNTTTRRSAGVFSAVVLAAVLGGAVAGAAPAPAPAPAPASVPVSAPGAHHDHAHRSTPIADEWAAAWNTNSPERMAALFTDTGSYTDHAFQATFTGKDGVAGWVANTHASIEDPRVEIVDAFRSGDRVAVRWEFSGTDIGSFAEHLPPTGKSFTVPVLTHFELKNGKIARCEDYYNLADLLRQVGLPSGVWTPPGA
ncbi:ester cyclase [Saccharothrix lopnurensis]|uniref:Ester cyclase n=1 Tax=Saccharothrix lopnurensis TaxID=1670621 RepID=A0ABW1P3K5_9PSEU